MMPDDKLKETVHQLEPVIGPQAKMLWYKYLNAKTPERKEAWRRRIKLLAEKALDSYNDEIRLPPPTPDQTGGDYQLGLVIYPDQPYSVSGLKRKSSAST